MGTAAISVNGQQFDVQLWTQDGVTTAFEPVRELRVDTTRGSAAAMREIQNLIRAAYFPAVDDSASKVETQKGDGDGGGDQEAGASGEASQPASEAGASGEASEPAAAGVNRVASDAPEPAGPRGGPVFGRVAQRKHRGR